MRSDNSANGARFPPSHRAYREPLLQLLRNFGPASIRTLIAAGIHDEEKLRAMGAVAAYLAVKRAGMKPSLNLLWAMEGALSGRNWKTVARDDRTTLLLMLDDLQREAPKP